MDAPKTHDADTALQQSQRGVIVLHPDGRELAALGLAAQAEQCARIVRGWHDARRRRQRVYTVEGEAGAAVVVIALPSAEFTVLVAAWRAGRDALFEFVASVDFAGDILQDFLTNPYEALTVVDRTGALRYVGPVHERFFGMQPGAGVGQHVTQIIENTRLHLVADSGKAEIGSVQEMRGVKRIVSRRPVFNSQGTLVGAVGQVMFKGPEQLQALSDELTRLRSEVAFYRRELTDLRNRSYGLDQIVGDSAAMQRLKQQIIKVAPLDIPVLLTGESGTGKELAAHAIHKLSPRRDAKLVMVNAAALPATLVESELFGYEGGSFTGAERKGKRGKIEQADNGSLFFDEVGDMPAEVQVKLLRVLQDGVFERVGGNEARHSNFRLISASNRNFETMIAEGSFRLDLFYRIGAVTIRMPSLRERLEDIPSLAELALRNFARRHSQREKRLAPEAIVFLQQQSWPGNVRQLMHTVERSAIFAEGEVIQPRDFGMVMDGHLSAELPLPAFVVGNDRADVAAVTSRALDGSAALPVRRAVGQVEEQLIRSAMARCHGNKKRAAQELGISRSYLYKRLAELGIDDSGQ